MSKTNNNIKSIREKNQLKQEHLCKAIGWNHVSRISQYELGHRKCTVDNSWLIVGAFKKLGLTVRFEDVFPPPKDIAA